MKEHLSGLFLVALVPVLCLFGIKFTQEKKQELLIEIEAQGETLNYKQKRLQSESTGIEQAQSKLKKIKSFIKQWEPYIYATADVLAQLDELSFKNTLAIEQKSISSITSYPLRGVLVPAKQVKARVSGQYPRINKWISAVMKTYPHARVQELNIQIEGSKTVLLLTMIIPELKNL